LDEKQKEVASNMILYKIYNLIGWMVTGAPFSCYINPIPGQFPK